MANLKAVDYDPFAQTAPQARGQIVPVDHDPFAETPFLDRSRADVERWQAQNRDKYLEPISNITKEVLPWVTGAAGAVVAAPESAGLASPLAFGMGYAAGKELTDDTHTFSNAAKNVGIGMAYDIGGQIAGVGLSKILPPFLKAAGWIWDKMPSFGTKALEKEAGQILVKNTAEGPIYASNAEEAVQIEQKIQGLKFTRGQRTADPAAIAKERSLFASTEGGKTLIKENEAKANEAIRQYYEKGFQGDTADTLNAIKQSQTGIEQTKSLAGQKVASEATRLGQGATAQQSGQDLYGKLRAGKEAAREIKNKLYAGIPNAPVSTSGKLLDAVRDIRMSTGVFEDNTANVPKVMNDIQSLMGTSRDINLGFQDLQSLKVRLNNDIRMERAAQAPNDIKIKRLAELKDWAVSEMGKVGDSKKYGVVADQFKNAETFYKEKYVPYKQGSIGEVLKPTAQGDLRIDSSKILDKFFNTSKLDDADALIRVMGENGARQSVKEYASQKLMNEATDPLTGDVSGKKLAGWLTKNKGILQKFGLQDDFKNIVKAQRSLDAWRGISEKFEKSIAAKMISEDASGITFDQGIAQAMQSPQKMNQLLSLVKGNRAGEAGLRKGVGDFILNQSRTTAEDIRSNPLISTAKLTQMIRRYDPALQLLYRDNPKQLETLRTINRAYEMLARTQRPTLSGSDTVEKLMPILQKGGDVAERIPVVGQAIGAIRTVTRLFKPYSQEKINQFLLKATFDPEYADTLIQAARGNNKVVNARIRNQMLSLGIYEIKKDTK